MLVDESTYRDSYSTGLAHDPRGVRWRDDDADARFAQLLARLRSYGVPLDLREPAAITHRLHRMLAHRPLLAPSPDELRAIRTALDEHQPRVEVATDTVLRALRAAL